MVTIWTPARLAFHSIKRTKETENCGTVQAAEVGVCAQYRTERRQPIFLAPTIRELLAAFFHGYQLNPVVRLLFR